MAVKIVKVEKKSFPALRFIGKRYPCNVNYGEKWGEWWKNNMFSPLDSLGGAAANEDSYCAVKRIHNGELEYWIGMFFDPGKEVPDGYDYVDMDALDYAVFWLYGDENSGELTSFETHNLCLEELGKSGFRRKEDDWCFEKYNCPRYTSPDEKGNVILDYGIAIEK